MVRISDIQHGDVLWATVPFCHINESEIDTYLLQKDDILFARTGGTVGKSFLVKDVPYPSIYAGYLIRTRYSNMLSAQYMKYFMECELYWEQLRNGTIATAQPNCNGKTLAKMILPIPPYNEQIRITDKLNQVLEQVRKYGESQDRLDKLNIQIHDLLKKSILQEAIQGRLVAQDASDEPASILLQRIKEEKLQLVKESKLKKKDVVDSVIFKGDDNKYYEQIGTHRIDITDSIPFDIPVNWSWCRIDDYVELVTDFVASGSFASLRENVKYYKTPNYAILVKAQDFQYDFQKDLTYTDRHGYDFLAGSNLFGGELILSNVGSIGKVFIVPKLDVRMSLAPNSIMVKPIYENQIKWLYYLFNSEFGVQLLHSISSATAIRKFNKTSFKKLIIPIPPTKEQKRIVKKIETVFDRIKGD